jgi:hypothetical protein
MMKRPQISKRDAGFFFSGMAIMFLIGLIADWFSPKKDNPDKGMK